MASNPNLRSPKKEEDEVVPEDVELPSATARNASGEIDIMDELEDILGIGKEEKKEESMFGNMEWDFMALEVEEEEEENKMKVEECFEECENDFSVVVKRENQGFWEEEKTISLNLNYQDVLDAWSDGRSPWADDYSLSMASDAFVGEVPVMEEEKNRREARVLRYKEKRQSRLFSKKIRYQVRKLNAEKRPRLKGRFVKRLPEKILR
ncbi:zinc finger protein CONSTANS-LIKE 7 isoform X2 [Magnolia sinica]|uniref:zinc finger protein CONSTANS-LIKE 7 isoform X2 n=1 Tax=Magnolia sinica TaxID=86752 RepID=UPI002659EEC6|nr:zinc finger protein CONSTANS-LIKE 7 isoform X2 [Magnolia sinica]